MYLKVMMPKCFQFKMTPSFPSFFMENKGDIHYIGGADILPAPLDAEEEAEVISDLGTEFDKKAKSIRIEHNLRLVVYIAKKFDNTGIGVEDLISIGTIGLIKAINSFDVNIFLSSLMNIILLFLQPELRLLQQLLLLFQQLQHPSVRLGLLRLQRLR